MNHETQKENKGINRNPIRDTKVYRNTKANKQPAIRQRQTR